MALRISDISKDLPKLNSELQRADLHQKQISELRSQVGQLQKKLLNRDSELANVNQLSQNNVTVTWTGTGTVAHWSDTYTRTNGHYLPILAGTQSGLVNTTAYWVGWNPVHKTMSFVTDIHLLVDQPVIIILFQVHAGTTGGGGTEAGGHGINGKQY